jgi:flagellar biosynthesis protein FlhF
MQVKRFVAANMRLALKMVREEMGPDAVILSNKSIAEGVEILTAIDVEAETATATANAEMASEGFNPFRQVSQTPVDESKVAAKPSKLELELERMQRDAKQRAEQLTASLLKKNHSTAANAYSDAVVSQPSNSNAAAADEDQFSQFMQSAAEKSSGANVDITEAAVAMPTLADIAANTGSVERRKGATNIDSDDHREDPGILQMRSELQGMRDLLEQQLSSIAWGQLRQQDPVKASMMRRLKRMGINAKIASALIDGVANTGTVVSRARQQSSEQVNWQQIMTGLSRKIPVVAEDLAEAGGVFAFVGPTGAGKTTTIGKLAARHVLKHGPTDIALVTMDSQRIGAHEQLRTFGRILNVPVKMVDKNNSLEKVLYSLRSKTLVLVDTSGLNRHDSRLQQQLQSIDDQGEKVQSVLVLPATSQSEVVKSVYHTYKTENLSASVVTKLDESMNIGEVLNLSIERQLPIAYVSEGQEVPDDIDLAHATKLVKKAIGLAHLVEINDEDMAAQMVSLSDIAM